MNSENVYLKDGDFCPACGFVMAYFPVENTNSNKEDNHVQCLFCGYKEVLNNVEN